MAAPRKSGLEYFPLDVDIFHDTKIIPLKARYGALGIAVYINILCKIYGNKGYYIEVNEDFYFVVSDETRVNENTIRQVVNFLLERSMFDNILFQSDKVLTSRSIQKRYQEAVTSRGRKNPVIVDEKYWLLKNEETRSFIKFTLFSEDNRKNEVNTWNNEGFSMEKLPKVKESKEKENKVNITPLPPCQEEGKTESVSSKKLLKEVWEKHKNCYSSELQAKILDWLKYKKEKREGYHEQGLNSLLVQIQKKAKEYGDSVVIDVINDSMASNYQGITWNLLKSLPQRHKGAEKPKQNRFVNYTQRSDYDYAELERMEREKIARELQNYEG